MSDLVQVPVDIDREDRLIAGLTARQLMLLGIAGCMFYGLYQLTAPMVPVLLYAVVVAPFAAVVVVIVLGQRDGISMDRLLVAAIRYRLSPRTHVVAPDGIPSAPDWLADRATSTPQQPVSLQPLTLPAQTVYETGIIDLGIDGLALGAQCSTVNFELRTAAEQDTYIDIFAQFLHTLAQPIQILIRTQRLDLAPQISDIRKTAGTLPHPALERSAREHADYLHHLASTTELLRRQVLLVFREPIPSTPIGNTRIRAVLPALVTKKSRRHKHIDDSVRQAAEARLLRRAHQAKEILALAGITVTPLDSRQATAVLSASCNPGSLVPTAGQLTAADDIITTSPDDENSDNPMSNDINDSRWTDDGGRL